MSVLCACRREFYSFGGQKSLDDGSESFVSWSLPSSPCVNLYAISMAYLVYVVPCCVILDTQNTGSDCHGRWCLDICSQWEELKCAQSKNGLSVKSARRHVHLPAVLVGLFSPFVILPLGRPVYDWHMWCGSLTRYTGMSPAWRPGLLSTSLQYR